MLLYYKERCVLFCAVVFVFKGPFPIFEKKGVSLKIYLSILSSLKITDEYKKLLVKNKFSLREDSRLLSALLPIVLLGSSLYIPVQSLTDIRCESVSDRLFSNRSVTIPLHVPRAAPRLRMSLYLRRGCPTLLEPHLVPRVFHPFHPFGVIPPDIKN